MTTAELFRAGADYLAEPTTVWGKGYYYSGGAVCAYGAMMHVAGGISPNHPAILDAQKCAEDWFSMQGRCYRLVGYNDLIARTKEEVVATMRELANYAEQHCK